MNKMGPAFLRREMRFVSRVGFVILLVTCSQVSVAADASWQSINSAVVTLYQQGKYSEASGRAVEALTYAERVFGPEHPSRGYQEF